MARNLPPGPRSGFLGYSAVRRFVTEPLEFITEVGRTYGDIAYFRMGWARAFLINNPELIRDILVTHGKQFRKERRALNALRQIDGEGLVITEGDFWLRQRRLLQPAFHARRMGKYAESIVDRTERLLARWQPGQTVDIVEEMTHLTVEIIAKVFYDTELTGKAARLGEAVRVLSQTFYSELTSPVKLPDWLPLPGKQRKRWAIATIDTLIRDIIRERRATGEDRGDLLSMLLLAVDEEGDGTGMSDEQARDEAVTMFNAGHDSTAAALAWIWYLVAKHPEVETRLVAETNDVLGRRGATADDLPNLRFAQAVVREALRLYPPVWALFARSPLADIELAGYTIPAGSWLYIFPWVTQRDARFFEDPERFDPDRFLPGRVEDIPQYAWIPFGAGPHICIGQSLALNEMVLITATLLQKFRLSFAPDQPRNVVPEPLLAIRPRGGLRMCVEQTRASVCRRSQGEVLNGDSV
jgi:cytochrome P450